MTVILHITLFGYLVVKDRSFTLQNSSDQIRYTPNNKGGIGIGFANTKINIDLGINIKNDDDVTERFDFETNLTLNKSTIGLSIQHYKGYNLESASSPESIPSIPYVFIKLFLRSSTSSPLSLPIPTS